MAEAQQEERIQQEEPVNNSSKTCAFYLSPRGCIKGDTCDFSHPVAPDGSVTTRVCDFFKSSKGCNKGAECNFLHPEGHVNNGSGGSGGVGSGARPCQYFSTPRGCIKGDSCDFAHPNLSTTKPCNFFMSPRGCAKGRDCDFSHGPAAGMMPGFGGMPAGMPNPFDAFAAGMGFPGMGQGFPGMGGQAGVRGAPGVPPHLAHKRPLMCQYHNTERGCVKGMSCDFVHQREKVCDFFASERGCKKGKYCEFQHPAQDDGVTGGKSTKETTNHRFSPY